MGFICHETIGGTAPPRGAPVKFVFGLGIGEVKGGMHYLVLFISQAILLLCLQLPLVRNDDQDVEQGHQKPGSLSRGTWSLL